MIINKRNKTEAPFMPLYGLLTNPSIDIISEINKIHGLHFDYAEIGHDGYI
jgi:hypothetical protein